MKKCLLFITLIFSFFTASSQYFEPFNVRYRLAPEVDLIESDSEEFSELQRETFEYIELMAKFPLILGKKERKSIVLPELIYKNSRYELTNYPANVPQPGNSELLRLSIKSSIPLSKKWNLLAFVYASHGRNDGVDWGMDNIAYRGGLGILMRNKWNHQMGVSLTYVGEIDGYFPSLIYKGKSKDNKWSFNVEAPQLSIIEYVISDRSRLRLEEKLDNEKYYFDAVDQSVESFLILNLNVGLGYSYRVVGPAFANISVGFTSLNNIRLHDSNADTVEDLRFALRPVLLAGFYVSLNPDDFAK